MHGPGVLAVGALSILFSSQATAQNVDWMAMRTLTGRHMVGIAYDQHRERLVVFSGNQAPNVVPPDTWELLGDTWQQRRPVVTPSARWGPAMVYDVAARRTLLFGGMAASPLADTWHWDGAEWRQLTPALSPSPRLGHVMTHDPIRQRTVLFGGESGAGGLADTFEWDGTNWLRFAPAISPQRRAVAGLLYDPQRARCVLFGGASSIWGAGIVYLNDTWEWDGTAWTQRTPTTRPPVRGYHAMAHDPVSQRTVVLAGFNGTRLSDAWLWDGTNWTSTSFPIARPRRSSAALDFETARNRLVLFGGVDESGLPEDTWARTGGAWNRIAPTTEPPSPREGAALAGGLGAPIVMFGGSNDLGNLAETWEWHGLEWQRLAPTNSPSARVGAAMARDPTRNRTVLFGGAGLGLLTDTWEWNGQNWSPVATPVSPTPRLGHALALDLPASRVLLFGGSVPGFPSRDLADTWTFDGSTWQQQSPATSPAPRSAHAMASDYARGRIVLFGGATSATILGDTHEWDGSTWLRMTSPIAPPATFRHAMAFDGGRGHVVLWGGSGQSTTTWEWNGATWASAVTTIAPWFRQGHAMAFDDLHRRVVMFGGLSTPPGTWVLGPVSRAIAGTFGLGCTGSVGVPVLTSSEPWLGNVGFALDLLSARPAALAVLALGLPANVPLPGGCVALVTPTDLQFVLTNATGFASLRYGVAANPALRGTQLTAQAAVLDPAGAGGGFALTAARTLRIGD